MSRGLLITEAYGEALETRQMKKVIRWPANWPDIKHVANFWFFGLKRRDLWPLPQDVVSEHAVEQWARRLHLVDRAGHVPDWVKLSAVKPDRVEELLQDGWQMSLHELPDVAERTAAAFPSSNPLVALLGPARRGNSDLELRLAEVRKDMYYLVGLESRSKAKKRIMSALDFWAEGQLNAAEISHLRHGGNISERKVPGKRKLKDFVRFQCEGTPIRDLIEPRAQDTPENLGRVLREDLHEIAGQLQLRLRRHATGRPRKG